MPEREIGHELVVCNVNGFHHAKSIIYDLIRARIVKCSECDNSATRVMWVDQAEWYPECNAHADHREMWVGFTKWDPSSFSICVLPEPTRAWLKQLPADERKNYMLREYDATDYYALLPFPSHPEQVWFVGSPDVLFKLYAEIHELTDGSFAYEVVRAWTHEHGGTAYHNGLTGGFDTREAAIEAARKEAQPEKINTSADSE